MFGPKTPFEEVLKMFGLKTSLIYVVFFSNI